MVLRKYCAQAFDSRYLSLFKVPETSGKTLEEMDEVFGSEAIAASDAERLAKIHRQIGLDTFLHGDIESAADEKSEKGSKN